MIPADFSKLKDSTLIPTDFSKSKDSTMILTNSSKSKKDLQNNAMELVNPENFPPLKTDPEFLRLMHPLMEQEMNSLQESLESRPLPYPVTSWKGICVDGWEAYRICREKQLPFRILQLNFSNRNQVISWICQKQLQHNSLSRERLHYLIGKRYETEKKQHPSTSGSALPPDFTRHDFDTAPPSDVSQGNEKGVLAAGRLGKEYGLAASTVVKYGVYARKIEILLEKDPDFTGKILSGTLKISHNNILTLSRLPAESIQALNQRLSTRKFAHLSYSALRRELPEDPASLCSKTVSENKILIKQKPKFNPDAGMESLIYTIPSWVRTMERVLWDTDFSIISNQAGEQLTRQIQTMQGAAQKLLSRMQEHTGGNTNE